MYAGMGCSDRQQFILGPMIAHDFKTNIITEKESWCALRD